MTIFDLKIVQIYQYSGVISKKYLEGIQNHNVQDVQM